VPDSTAIAHGAHETDHPEHPPYLRHHFETTDQQADAAGFAMWIFLLTENFPEIPIVDHEAYDYEWLERQKEKEVASVG